MNLTSFYSAIVVFEFDLYAMSCFYSIICWRKMLRHWRVRPVERLCWAM